MQNIKVEVLESVTINFPEAIDDQMEKGLNYTFTINELPDLPEFVHPVYNEERMFRIHPNNNTQVGFYKFKMLVTD